MVIQNDYAGMKTDLDQLSSCILIYLVYTHLDSDIL